MRNWAVVSERGTVTIPESIREMVNIHPGDLVKFTPEKDGLILKHLLVKYADEETFMNERQWDEFDKLVQRQLREKRYTRYENIEKAKGHSRSLMLAPKR